MDQFSKSKKKINILAELNLGEAGLKSNKNSDFPDNDKFGYMLPLLQNLKSQSIDSESSINAVNFFFF